MIYYIVMFLNSLVFCYLLVTCSDFRGLPKIHNMLQTRPLQSYQSNHYHLREEYLLGKVITNFLCMTAMHRKLSKHYPCQEHQATNPTKFIYKTCLFIQYYSFKGIQAIFTTIDLLINSFFEQTI